MGSAGACSRRRTAAPSSRGGHDEGWENYMIGFDQPGTGLVLMTNSSNGDSIFKELLATLIGDTYTPWEWEAFIPWNANGQP
jgi:hypothetical protein